MINKLPLALLPLIFLACSQKERVVYKEVKTPIKCNIDMPRRPQPSGDLIQDLANILTYTELLEKDLTFCVKQ